METLGPERDAISLYLSFTGTQVNYYFVCERKLWLFSHGVELETNSDLVRLGKLLHEQSYGREFKEVQIGRIKIDFLQFEESSCGDGTKSVVVHEVKKSKAIQGAHVIQVLYYVYYLKHVLAVDAKRGVLHYPLSKSLVSVELNSQGEEKVRQVLRDVARVVELRRAPTAVWMKKCRSCAYAELCWG